ncbi:hypothetical protein SAMN05443287_105228 [Micromonospora phaseoli]|uniref:Uncharacterized protein n=1 Tax=Micromonospora phaseoli TaxID=1144548 RepID=A0A1H6ZQ23_9ACTN|nr:hypothetical protein [Micromonospora phaseoli]PZV97077.1 hypothetical protein CLV64_106185 [Micromonospora phaseoli]GIJ77344.1 hypothetical protein Xph01_17760 [Micromonospora phaseoli]SEJ55481.1 hypothetical protein SAMN05443287_105228 [Micromonospora phaseoli]
MRDPGVGRSGGLTDWYLMNVVDMWACLQDHDTDNHWRHVAGWRKVCDLAGQHLGRLRTYRESLAQAWPPETNAASRAYLVELDALIDQAQRTHDAAASNQTALSAATQALSSTRTQIKKIYDEYAGKLQLKRSWEETAADPKAVAGSRASQPPVTDSDLEHLNIQARGIMYGLSGELQQAQVLLRHPPSPPRSQPARDQPLFDNSAISGNSIPVIPPIMPTPSHTPARSATTQPPSIPQSVPTPISPIAGPILSGASPGPTPAFPNPMPTTTPSPTSPILGTPPTPMPPSGRQVAASSGRIQPGQVSRPSSGGPHAMPRAMPPGGLIGGIPGSGLSQPTAGGGQPRRVNPIGGVIGGGGAGTGPTGAAGSRPGNGRGIGGSYTLPIGGSPYLGFSGTSATGGISNADRRGSDEPRRWDPDDPWETDQGVNPVVRPPDDDGPIDPGPAIGLGR